MRDWKPGLVYLTLAGVVIALGLASRTWRESLPVFLADYSGDTLWGLMVFLGFSAVAPRAMLLQRVAIAITFAWAVEFSQLYHAAWIDAIRGTTLGGLVLGFDFVWSDLVCYTAGIVFGAGVEACCHRTRRS